MFYNETDKLDQHFLIDEDVINRFIKEADLKKTDVVVEVGPGKGNISKLIQGKVKKLYLIEKDYRLKPFLDKIDAEVIYDSVLDTFIPKCDKIVTSLPYSIIEPFISKIIRCDCSFILMITGSNYASSVTRKKITKLSLLTNAFFKAEKIMDILPDSFDPKPRVLSTMIKLTKIKETDLSDKMIIFRNLFFYQDKKLKNALVESIIRLKYLKGEKLTQKEARDIVKSLDLDSKLLDKKFETISNKELVYLDEKITNHFN